MIILDSKAQLTVDIISKVVQGNGLAPVIQGQEY